MAETIIFYMGIGKTVKVSVVNKKHLEENFATNYGN